MPDILSTIITGGLTVTSFLICTAVSLALGAAIAVAFRFRTRVSSGLSVTTALLPAVVQLVIMLVNGNLGVGLAVAGAFSLVRFRSTPGTAREICSLFTAMAVGLATGTGYVGVAVIFTVILLAMNTLYAVLRFGEERGERRELKITIPEALDYEGLFDDVLARHTSFHSLTRVKTTNMGSMFQLDYDIQLLPSAKEKAFLDELRCLNGNLSISLGRVPTAQPRDEL